MSLDSNLPSTLALLLRRSPKYRPLSASDTECRAAGEISRLQAPHDLRRLSDSEATAASYDVLRPRKSRIAVAISSTCVSSAKWPVS